MYPLLISAGSTLSYSAIQALTLVGGERWYSFIMGGQAMLVLGGEMEVQLLAWRGVFTSVQVGIIYNVWQVIGRISCRMAERGFPPSTSPSPNILD